MIDDNDFEPVFGGFGERQMGGGAAIDGDDNPRALRAQPPQGDAVGAIAFAQAVRDVDSGADADRREEPGEKRRGGGAVDIVIGENSDGFAVADGADEARGGDFHVAQMRGVRQLIAQSGSEKPRGMIEIDAALGQ